MNFPRRPRMDLDRYERFVNYRQLFEYLARLAMTPVKFPAQRRRRNRQLPKAA